MSQPQPTNSPPPPTQAGNKHGDAGKILNPEDVPIRYGKRLQPFPSPHPEVKFDPIKWFWVPAFQFDIFFILSLLVFLFLIAGAITYAAAPTSAGLAGGSFLIVVALVIWYLRVNLGINQSLRTAICRCYAKRETALRLWESSDARDYIFQKDVLHTEKSFFYELAVLRDGTVEIRNGNSDRINSQAGSLDIGMQTSLNANAFTPV
ncbi:hypothetical protein FGB62_214g021 [Gracilaria domingensis]|nr:hypothetical protein FGB62_214g021 [Gracilaria domingensis]